jgi:hypothetical protein
LVFIRASPFGKIGKAFQAWNVIPENPKEHFKLETLFRKNRKDISSVKQYFGKSEKVFQK